MLIDETPRSFVKKNNSYSHCPLKKRPVTVLLSEEILPKTEIKEELIDVVVSDESSEPENLSTKPEDLSKNSGEKRQRSRSPSPLPAKIRRVSPIPTSPIVPQPPTTLPTLHHQIHHHHHHQQQQQHQQYQPLFPSKALTPPVGIAPVVHPVARKARIEILQHDSTSAAVGQMHFLSNNLVSNPEAASYWARHSAAAAALYPSATISPNAASPPSHHHQHYLPAAYQQQHYQQDMYPAYPVPGYPHHSTSPELPRPIPHWPTTAGSPPVATSPEDLSNSPSSDSGRSSAGSTSAGSVHSHHHHQEKSPNHHQAPRYQCPDCNKSYSTYSGLSKHQQFHCAAAEGQPKKTFSCKFCDKLYLTLGALKMHIRTHTLPCKCHLCGKAFSRPWLLQGHIRTHTGEKPFSCQHCNRAFADRSNLRAHLQTHSDVKKYSCAQCSKTFSRMSLLGKHQEAGCPGVNPQIVQQPQVPLGYAC